MSTTSLEIVPGLVPLPSHSTHLSQFGSGFTGPRYGASQTARRPRGVRPACQTCFVTPSSIPSAAAVGSSDLYVGFLAAGAAILASLIAGGLAYFGMRRQLSHDREMRLLEARRVAYARMLGVAFDTVNYLSFQGVPWRVETIRRMVTSSLSRVMMAVVEVRLLADEAVTRAAEDLADAVREGATFAFDAIGKASDRPRGALLLRPKHTPVLNAPGYDEVLAKLGKAATAFVNATKAEMRLDPVPPSDTAS
jgi:hypothetical protein